MRARGSPSHGFTLFALPSLPACPSSRGREARSLAEHVGGLGHRRALGLSHRPRCFACRGARCRAACPNRSSRRPEGLALDALPPCEPVAHPVAPAYAASKSRLSCPVGSRARARGSGSGTVPTSRRTGTKPRRPFPTSRRGGPSPPRPRAPASRPRGLRGRHGPPARPEAPSETRRDPVRRGDLPGRRLRRAQGPGCQRQGCAGPSGPEQRHAPPEGVPPPRSAAARPSALARRSKITSTPVVEPRAGLPGSRRAAPAPAPADPSPSSRHTFSSSASPLHRPRSRPRRGRATAPADRSAPARCRTRAR